MRWFGAICGIAAPAVAFIAIATSILLSPWFSWHSNALSDLGNYARSTAAIVFNTGLFISGVLTSVFGMGVINEFKDSKVGKVGAIFLFVAGIALACIGILSEDAGVVHFYVSVAFFSAFPISLLILGPAIFMRRKPWLGAFTLLIAFLTAFPWSFQWDGVAIPEAISATFASLWAITISLKMLKG